MIKLQICCLIIVVFIMCIYFSARRVRSYEHNIFVWLLACTVMNLCFDMVTVYTVHHLEEVPAFINRILHNCFISSITIVIYLVFLYVVFLINQEKGIFKGKFRWVKYPPVLQIGLMWILPMSYTQTPKGNYCAGPAPTMTYCMVAYYFMLALILLWHYRMSINRKKLIIIIMALIIEGSASICEALYTHLLVSGFGTTMLCLALFLTVENPDVHLVERLREERKKAQEANLAKSAFLAGMSHEIRTPINGVIGMNEMILRECKQGEIREYALYIKSAAQTLLSIVSDILDLSKIESGKMEISCVEYELSSLLKDVYHIILERAKIKNLEIKIHVDEEVPAILYGDDVRIRQILMNLLTNAVKYTEKGTVALSIKEQKRNDDNVTLYFEVQDTGIGIEKENIARLFTAFERLDEVKHRKIEGIGLGLALTRQFLEMMGSDLAVQSEYGKGSTFSFCLEQKIMSVQKIGDFERQIGMKSLAPVYQSKVYAPNAHILLVDDNEINRKVFTTLLKESGIEITQATSGRECLDWMKKKDFDLIFLDHMMPDMDGVETYEVAKTLEGNKNIKTPVIMFTANAVTGAKERYQELGFDGYLSKPFKAEKVETMIIKLLPEELLEEKDADTMAAISAKEVTSEDTTEKMSKKTAEQIEAEPAMTELPYIDGIDWEYARIHLEDPEMIRSVTQDFVKRLKAERIEINALAERLDNREELKAFQTRVHALKSSAALIGVLSVAAFARTIEYAAEAGNLDKIRTLLPVLNEEMLLYEERLQIFLPQKAEKSKERMEDRSVILAMLEMLRLSAMACDVDAVDAAMGQLNTYSYEQKLQEQIDRLKGYVQEIKMEEIQELIDSMMKTL